MKAIAMQAIVRIVKGPALAFLLVIGGCSLASEPGARPMGEKPPSASFQGTLETEGRTWQFSGGADFADISGEHLDSSQPLFSIQMHVWEGGDGVIAIERNSRRTGSGRYTISSVSKSGADFSGSFGPGFSIPEAGWEYRAESGELVLHRSTNEVVEGRFEFEAEGQGPYGLEITLSGSFTAVPQERS